MGLKKVERGVEELKLRMEFRYAWRLKIFILAC